MEEQKPQGAFVKLLMWIAGFIMTMEIMGNSAMAGNFNGFDALVILAGLVAIPITAVMSFKSLSDFVISLVESSKQKSKQRRDKEEELADILEEIEELKRKNRV